MTLAQLIRDEKTAVVDRWYDLVLSTYPGQTAKVWKANTDRFTNPVGQTTLRVLGTLVDQLLRWDDAKAVCAPLEELVKIRAVQDFTPAKALSFVFFFKKVLRELFAETIAREGLGGELAVFDGRVDNLALMAFDIYVKSREELYRMRVDEFKHAHRMLFRKAGLMCDSAEVLGGGAPPSQDEPAGTE